MLLFKRKTKSVKYVAVFKILTTGVTFGLLCKLCL